MSSVIYSWQACVSELKMIGGASCSPLKRASVSSGNVGFLNSTYLDVDLVHAAVRGMNY